MYASNELEKKKKPGRVPRSTGASASPVRDNDTGRCRLVNYRRTKFIGTLGWIPLLCKLPSYCSSRVYDTHLHLRCVRLQLGYRPRWMQLYLFTALTRQRRAPA